MTQMTSSIVSDVSAMFVEITTFRTPGGGLDTKCSAGSRGAVA